MHVVAARAKLGCFDHTSETCKRSTVRAVQLQLPHGMCGTAFVIRHATDSRTGRRSGTLREWPPLPSRRTRALEVNGVHVIQDKSLKMRTPRSAPHGEECFFYSGTRDKRRKHRHRPFLFEENLCGGAFGTAAPKVEAQAKV